MKKVKKTQWYTSKQYKKGIKLFKEGKCKRAMDCLLEAAELGSWEAKDKIKDKDYIRKAAKSGHKYAQYMYGVQSYHGLNRVRERGTSHIPLKR